MSRFLLVGLFAIVMAWGAVDAGAQSTAAADTMTTAPSDTLSSAAPDSIIPGSLGEAMRRARETTADSTAVADTSAVSTAGQEDAEEQKKVSVPWWAAFRPTLTTGVSANVTQQTFRVGVSAPVFESIGATGNVRYNVSRTTYRQFDRDQEDSSLLANLKEELGESVELAVDFSRTTNFDENRPEGIDPIILDFESADARASLKGDHSMAAGFSHHWALRTRIEDVNQSSRNVRNDRSLATAGLTSVWKRTGDDLGVSARYGYERSTGDRRVRGVTDDATVEVDTLRAKVDVFVIPRADLRLEAGRATFFEERLDFVRNANGVVDTVNVPDPVGQEREVREGYDLVARGNAKLLPKVRVNADAKRDYSETVFRLSRQGVVQKGSESFNAGTTWSYADAGSLKVGYSYSDRYNDRRAQGDQRFRGRESTLNYSADAQLRQALFAQSDLLLSASQTLTQSVFEETNNENDRDRLVDEVVGEIGTGALPHTDLTIRGTVRNTSEINIAANRVGNNKDELLYEVRTSYTFDPPGGFSASQTYRLQIVFRDFIDGIERDSFNKQGQVTTQVDYTFPEGGRFALEYLSDYRSTGARDESSPIRELYVTESVRNDRRLKVDASLPVFGLTVAAGAERGFLDQDTRGRLTEEERGQLSLRTSGQWKFRDDRVILDLDVERVLQFGPRVRAEQEDYWVANSTLTVNF